MENQNELMHYGVLGMKWGHHLHNIYDRASNFGTQRANMRRKALKEVALAGIQYDRTTGLNTRRDYLREAQDKRLDKSVIAKFTRSKKDDAELLQYNINRANRIFGSDSNWGSMVTESSMNRAKNYIKDFSNYVLDKGTSTNDLIKKIGTQYASKNKYEMSSLSDINAKVKQRQAEIEDWENFNGLMEALPKIIDAQIKIADLMSWH